ncbi:alpha/beta hydrolase [Sorangium atrum]|uniref:Alpha/beta hydrolase n=1 Tax=Sorangium atrum TaxID=2995308 RepID=A0ABT5C1S2_9BACT|nr:alpha/beta hydrolase [Sorangium aterium]MDC0679923.1 alpha/beta hydrolase [Sorangium aterium]
MMLRLMKMFGLAFVETTTERARRGPARPSWGFGFEWVVRFLRRDFAYVLDRPYPDVRAELDARPYSQKAVRRVKRTDDTLKGVPAVWFEPPGAASRGVVLYLHGGSYLFGSTRTHADLMARLALASGARVVGIDYRLAPEHRYPAQLEDALAAFDALVERGHAPGELALAGDSAGGNLALVTQLAQRDRGAQARCAALISPWLDLTASSASAIANDSTDYGTREGLLRQARDFAGATPLDDPRLSPLHARLEGLASLFIQVGDAERLHDEGQELARRAREAGVDVTLDVLRDMPHNGPVLADFHPEGARGTDALGAYLRARLSSSAAAATRPDAA